tara:strand:+ start:28 stop:444 length:417 start_codon:yes stop_codon:yes gene_type:complete
MKIHVAKMSGETIEGYKHVVVSDNHINFMDISQNECSEILANDVLDSFSSDKSRDCIVSLVDKLRLGGKLVVGGKDLRLFCRSVINGSIDNNEASQLLQNTSSMPLLNDVILIVQSIGLKVLSTQISGIHFEIVAQRG